MALSVEVNVFLIFLRLDVLFEVDYLTNLKDSTNQEEDKDNNRMYHRRFFLLTEFKFMNN